MMMVVQTGVDGSAGSHQRPEINDTQDRRKLPFAEAISRSISCFNRCTSLPLFCTPFKYVKYPNTLSGREGLLEYWFLICGKYIMYNSFLLIFHNHLHLIIDLSLICNAHYSYELRMLFISHYRSSMAKTGAATAALVVLIRSPSLERSTGAEQEAHSFPGNAQGQKLLLLSVLWRVLSACQQSEGHVSCYLFNCAVTASSSMSFPVLTCMTNCRKTSDC